MKLTATMIIGTVIAALLLGILLPIALNDILGFDSTNTTIKTLVATVLPIIAVVSIVLMFMPKSDEN